MHSFSIRIPRTGLNRWALAPLAMLAFLGSTWLADSAAAQDVVEFQNGAKVEGRVIEINRQRKLVTFEAKVGARTLERTYSYDTIHAVTYNGQRYVLNPKPGDPAVDPVSPGITPRTRAEIVALIDRAGASPPSWYEQTPLDYPQSLDLEWPEPTPQPWNNQKNVGQYIWDIINPNANRWQSGVRFVHHLISLHRDDAAKSKRIMAALGGMYFRFFQDYERSAFWWRQAGIARGDVEAVGLAECYHRLGNSEMAIELIVDADKLARNNNTIRTEMIKLWGDMGQPEKAVKLAEMYVKVGGQPQLAYLLAADSLRLAGKYPEAIGHYQKVLDAPLPEEPARVQQTVDRAKASQEAIKLFELSDVSKVADGTYRARSRGYEGPIEVEVEVAGGRILNVRVVKHSEKQFYSALTDAPNQILQKQGVKGVDATSRATITAEAIINATAKGLASGAK